MTSLSLEEIVKWAIAGFLIVIGLYLLYINFIPGASEQFWGKINNATGFLKFGQEKLDYEFEMPSYMVDNVKTINKTIRLLKDSSVGAITTEGIIEQRFELKDFQGCELTINQDSAGNLRFMVKNVKGQIEYYKSYFPYPPCIINLDNKETLITPVDQITFSSKDEFRINNEKNKYTFVNLIKKGENICFGGKS